MGVEIRVSGGSDLAEVRRRLKQVGDTGLGKQLGRGLRAAGRPLERGVRVEVPRTMPSGYAPVLSRSLRFRQQLVEAYRSATLAVRVYGDGQRERRAVPALNRGVLRHPVFGRTRRVKRHAVFRATSVPNPWVVQRVTPGFVDRPVQRLGPEVQKQMLQVVQDVADRLTKG